MAELLTSKAKDGDGMKYPISGELAKRLRGMEVSAALKGERFYIIRKGGTETDAVLGQYTLFRKYIVKSDFLLPLDIWSGVLCTVEVVSKERKEKELWFLVKEMKGTIVKNMWKVIGILKRQDGELVFEPCKGDMLRVW